MSRLTQFHTIIDKTTLKQFKNLCKSYNAPLSKGIRALIEKALDDNKLPLINKPGRNNYINDFNLGQILNFNHLEALSNQKNAVKIVRLISRQIISNGKSSYWSFVAQLQLQLLLLAVGLDSHVLKKYITSIRNNSFNYWPKSTLEFLYLAYFIDRDGMINYDNKWYSESLNLSNYLYDRYLYKYINESLLKQQALYFDLSKISELRPIIDWHLITFIKQNTTLETRKHMPKIKGSRIGLIFKQTHEFLLKNKQEIDN